MRRTLRNSAWLPALMAASLVPLPYIAGCPQCEGAACNKPDAALPIGSCPQDESFSRQSAFELQLDTNIEQKICPVGDQDYWRFQTTASDLAEVTLTRAAGISPVDLQVNILNEQGMALGGTQDSNGADGATELRTVVKLAPNTTYFVVVQDLGGDEFDNQSSYTLSVKLHTDPDTHEPNNTVEQATAANITAAGNTGHLASSGDTDLFTFTAEAGQIARVTLGVPTAATINPVATITAPDGTTTVFTSGELVENAGTRQFRANVALRGAGLYTATVADPEGGADMRAAEGQYTFTVELVQDPDADERALTARNDTRATAIQITNPTAVATRNPSLSTLGDEDNFVIEVPAASAMAGNKLLEVTVDLPTGTGNPSFRPVLTVWDQVIWMESNPSALCTFRAAPTAGYICGKTCTGSGPTACAGGRGGMRQECIANDPDMPTVDRFCAEPRLSRTLTVREDGSARASIRYPLRSARNPVITLSDELTDSYDERVFTVTFQIVDDPDTQEPNDLPPTLLAIGGSSTDARDQDLQYFQHPNIGPGGQPTLCPQPVDAGVGVDAGAPPPGCLGRETPDGGMSTPWARLPVDCGSYEGATMEVSGYLSYEGDRDYYEFNVPPGFYGIDVDYEFDPPGSATTPVELGVFVYVANDSGLTGSSPLRGSFVLTEQIRAINANLNCQFDTDCPNNQDCEVRPGMGICKLSTGETGASCDNDSQCASNERCRPNGPTGGVCQGACASNAECGAGNLCLQDRCFADRDDNPGTNGMATFGPSTGECLYAHQCNDRPLYVEVVDNGTNDSDRVTPYRLRVHVSCGCPQVCDSSSVPYCSSPQITCNR